MTQFTAAFDDTIVNRYSKDGTPKEKIKVRYVMGPKQRVMHDIVNQAKTITLPAISLEHKNIKRDSSRIQFKDQKVTRPNYTSNSVSRVPTPIPVSMDVEVMIASPYKEDIDQIATNIIAFFNPYIIISWKVPPEFGMDFIDELRTEVTWSGSIDWENPINITGTDKYVVNASTSFSVKGWIFPPTESTVAPIYVINTDFVSVSSGSNMYSYNSLLEQMDETTTDTILISAYPEFTNYFINGIPFEQLSINNFEGNTITFYGKRFNYNNTWAISADGVIPGLEYIEIDTAKFPTISAYQIPNSYVTVSTDNIAFIGFSTNLLSGFFGNYTFVCANSAGWCSSELLYFDVDNTDNMVYNGFKLVYNGQEMIYSS